MHLTVTVTLETKSNERKDILFHAEHITTTMKMATLRIIIKFPHKVRKYIRI